MNDELKSLFEFASSYIDLGSYDEFVTNMGTTESRKSFYDFAVDMGLELGEYDAYEAALKKKELGAPATMDMEVARENFGEDFFSSVLAGQEDVSPRAADDAFKAYSRLRVGSELLTPVVNRAKEIAPKAFEVAGQIDLEEVAVSSNPEVNAKLIEDAELSGFAKNDQTTLRMVKNSDVFRRAFQKNPKRFLSEKGLGLLSNIVRNRKNEERANQKAREDYFGAAPTGSLEYGVYEFGQRDIAGSNEIVSKVLNPFDNQLYDATNILSYYQENYDEAVDIASRVKKGLEVSNDEKGLLRSMTGLEELVPVAQQFVGIYDDGTKLLQAQAMTPKEARQYAEFLQKSSKLTDIIGEVPDWLVSGVDAFSRSGTGQLISAGVNYLNSGNPDFVSLDELRRDEDGNLVGIDAPIASTVATMGGVMYDFAVAKGIVKGAAIGAEFTGLTRGFNTMLTSLSTSARIPFVADLTNTMNAVRAAAQDIAIIEGVETEAAIAAAIEQTPKAARYLDLFAKGKGVITQSAEFAAFESYAKFGEQLNVASKGGDFDAWAVLEAIPGGAITGATIGTTKIFGDKIFKRGSVTLSAAKRKKYLSEVDNAYQELSFKYAAGAITKDQALMMSRQIAKQEAKLIDIALDRATLPGADVLAGFNSAVLEGAAFAFVSAGIHGEPLTADSIIDSIEFILMMKYGGKAMQYMKIGGAAMVDPKSRATLAAKVNAAWESGLSQRYTEAKTAAEKRAAASEAFKVISNIYSDAEILGGAAASNSLKKRTEFVNELNETTDRIIITTEGLLENVSNGGGQELRDAFEYASEVMDAGGEIPLEAMEKSLDAAKLMLADARSMPTDAEGGSISQEHKDIVVKVIDNWINKLSNYEGTYIDVRSVDAKTTSISTTISQKNRRAVTTGFRGTRRLLDGAEAEVRDANGNLLGTARLTRDKSNGQVIVRGQLNRLKANESIKKIKFLGSVVGDNGELIGLKYEVTSGKNETPYELLFKAEANGDHLYDVALFEAQKIRGRMSRAEVAFSTTESFEFGPETVEREFINPPQVGIVAGRTVDGRQFETPAEYGSFNHGKRKYAVLGGPEVDIEAKARYLFAPKNKKQLSNAMQTIEALHKQALENGNYVVVFQKQAEVVEKAKELSDGNAPNNVGAFYHEATNTQYVSLEGINEVFHEAGHTDLLKLREANPFAYDALTSQISELFLPTRSHAEGGRDSGKEISYMTWAAKRYGVNKPLSELYDEAAAEFLRDVKLGKIKMDKRLRNTMAQLANGEGGKPSINLDVTSIPKIEDLVGQNQASIVEGRGITFDRSTGDVIFDSLVELNKDQWGGIKFSLEEQAKVTKDRLEFKNWFGESKTVETDGTPTVYGHMTRGKFDQFERRGPGIFLFKLTGEMADGVTEWETMYQDMVPNGTDRVYYESVGTPDGPAKYEIRREGSNELVATIENFAGAREFTYTWNKSYSVIPLFAKAEKPWDYDNITPEQKSQFIDAFVARFEPTLKDGSDYYDAVLNLLSGFKPATSAEELKTQANAIVENMRSGAWTYIEMFDGIIQQMGYDSYYVEEFGKKNLAVFNAGQAKSVFSKDFNPNDLRFSIIGELGAYMQPEKLEMLDKAKVMRGLGNTPEEIWAATGWTFDADNKWKTEIDDSQAVLRPDWNQKRSINKSDLSEAEWSELYSLRRAVEMDAQGGIKIEQAQLVRLRELENRITTKKSLREVLDFPLIFQMYPKLEETIFESETLSGGTLGYYAPAINKLVLHSKLKPALARSVMLHELQHGIQRQEGFATGGNQGTWKIILDSYKNFSVTVSPSVMGRKDFDEATIETETKYVNKKIKGETSRVNKYIKSLQAQRKKALSPEAIRKIDVEIAGVELDYQNFISKENAMLDTLKDVKAQLETAREEKWGPAFRKVNELKARGLGSFDIYERLLGEIESRNVQKRAETNERTKTFEQTADVAYADNVVINTGEPVRPPLRWSLTSEEGGILKQRNNEELLNLIPQTDRVFGKNMPTLSSKPRRVTAVSGEFFSDYVTRVGAGNKELLANKANMSTARVAEVVSEAFEKAIKDASYGDANLEADLRAKAKKFNVTLPDAEFVHRGLNEATTNERFWYEVSADKFIKLFGNEFTPKEIHQIIKLVGATSPRTGPLENFRRSISAFALHLQGKPIDTTILIDKTVTEALFSEEFSGEAALKITNFADTFAYIAGLTNRAPLSTNDVWVNWLFKSNAENAFAGNTDLYDMVSRWFINTTKAINESLPEGTEPLQPWQLQALLWTRGRIETNKAEDGDDMASVFEVIERQMLDAGIEMPNGEFTREIMLREELPILLSPMIQSQYDAKTALVAAETGSDRLVLMERAVAKAKDLGVSDKLIERHITGPLARIEREFRSMIGTKASDSIIRKHDPSTSSQKKSVVTYLMNAIQTSVSTASRIKLDAYEYTKGEGGVRVSIPLAHFVQTGRALNAVEANVFMQTVGLGLGDGKYELNRFEVAKTAQESNAIGVLFEGTVLEPDQLASLSSLLDVKMNVRNVPNGTFVEISERGKVEPSVYGEVIEGLGINTYKFVPLYHESQGAEVSRKSLNQSIRELAKSSQDGAKPEGTKRNWEQRVSKIEKTINILKDIKRETDNSARDHLKSLYKMATEDSRTELSQSNMAKAIDAVREQMIKGGFNPARLKFSLIDPPRIHEENVADFGDADLRLTKSNTLRAMRDSTYRTKWIERNVDKALREIEDSSRPWKDAMRAIGNERAYKIFRNKWGADGMVREAYGEVYQKIFSDITPEEYAGFSDAVAVRRIGAIFKSWVEKIETNQANIETNNFQIEMLEMQLKAETDRDAIKAIRREISDLTKDNKRMSDANDVMTDKVFKYKDHYTNGVAGLEVKYTDPNNVVREGWDDAVQMAQAKYEYLNDMYKNTLFRDFGNESARIEGKIDEYYAETRKLLDMLHEEGILTDARLEGMDGIDYTRVEYMNYVLTEFLADNVISQASSAEAEQYIKGLNYGSTSKPFVNPEYDMATMISSAHRAVFENRAKKAMIGAFIEHAQLYGFDSQNYIKQLIAGESNPGYESMSYYDNGQRVEVLVRRDLYDSYKSPARPAVAPFQFTNNLLKTLATGVNPRFAIKNYLRDNLYAAMFTTHFDMKDGFGRGFLPITLARAFKASSKGMADYVRDRKGVEKDDLIRLATEQGFFFDGLIRQGIEAGRDNPYGDIKVSQAGQTEKATLWSSGFNYVKEILSASEYGMRVSILKTTFEQANAKFMEDNGRKPNDKEVEEMMIDAVYEARSFIDFSKGGRTAKMIDAYVPYFNAAVQGTVNAMRGVKNDPLLFSYKASQYVGAKSMFYMWNTGMMFKLMANLLFDTDEELAKEYEALAEEMRFDYLTIDPLEMENNQIIMIPIKQKKDEKFMTIKMPTPPELAVINVATEALMKNALGDKTMTDEGEARELINAMSGLFIVPDATSSPLIKGSIAALFNYDTFMMRNIDRDDIVPSLNYAPERDNKAFYVAANAINKVPVLSNIDWMNSPKRLQRTFYSFLPQSNTFVNLSSRIVDYGLANLLDQPALEKRSNWNDFIGIVDARRNISSAFNADLIDREANSVQYKIDNEVKSATLGAIKDKSPSEIMFSDGIEALTKYVESNNLSEEQKSRAVLTYSKVIISKMLPDGAYGLSNMESEEGLARVIFNIKQVNESKAREIWTSMNQAGLLTDRVAGEFLRIQEQQDANDRERQ